MAGPIKFCFLNASYHYVGLLLLAKQLGASCPSVMQHCHVSGIQFVFALLWQEAALLIDRVKCNESG